MTDDPTLPHGEIFCRPLPADLMQAATSAHISMVWLKAIGGNDDTCFVGVDCIVLQDPGPALRGRFGMAVTYRDARSRYPINTGLMYISENARERARSYSKGSPIARARHGAMTSARYRLSWLRCPSVMASTHAQ
jgi:hypothetical protein